jgi:prolyl 4-hydroxylase
MVEQRRLRTESGDAELAYRRALGLAAAAGSAQAWDAALVALTEAAAAGEPRAEAEHALLMALGQSQRLDAARLLAVPPIRVQSASPRIAVVADFAAPELCLHLIALARPKLMAARVYDPETGEGRAVQVRNNSECHLSAEDGIVPSLVRARIGRVTELPMGAMERTAILHYLPGQRFEPHFDFFDPEQAGPKQEIARGGQRVLTFLLTLNEDYEGGETEFPLLGRRYKGATGTALFFWNVEPNGAPDRRTRHAGLAPSAGEKWLLSQWVRERARRSA